MEQFEPVYFKENMMNRKALILPLKSVVVGASMLVPGVSGGTMAILLGIYDDIIHAVSSFMQAPK